MAQDIVSSAASCQDLTGNCWPRSAVSARLSRRPALSLARSIVRTTSVPSQFSLDPSSLRRRSDAAPAAKTSRLPTAFRDVRSSFAKHRTHRSLSFHRVARRPPWCRTPAHTASMCSSTNCQDIAGPAVCGSRAGAVHYAAPSSSPTSIIQVLVFRVVRPSLAHCVDVLASAGSSKLERPLSADHLPAVRHTDRQIWTESARLWSSNAPS